MTRKTCKYLPWNILETVHFHPSIDCFKPSVILIRCCLNDDIATLRDKFVVDLAQKQDGETIFSNIMTSHLQISFFLVIDLNWYEFAFKSYVSNLFGSL